MPRTIYEVELIESLASALLHFDEGEAVEFCLAVIPRTNDNGFTIGQLYRFSDKKNNISGEAECDSMDKDSFTILFKATVPWRRGNYVELSESEKKRFEAWAAQKAPSCTLYEAP